MRLVLLFAMATVCMGLAAQVPAEREAAKDGDGAKQFAEAPEFDLSGRWVLTLPAGWQRKITIERASADTYSVLGVNALVMNAIYEIDLAEDRLVMLEANDPKQADFEWRILNANTLELVRNGGPNRGSYVGATLSRHFDWDELVENSRAPRVGAKSPASRPE